MLKGILYLQRLRQLLQMECNNEREEFRLMSERISVKRKVRRGFCWYPIKVRNSFYNALNQFVVEIYREHDEETEDIEQLFESGRPVQFFKFNGKDPSLPIQDKSEIQYFPFTSTVSFVDGDRMVVTLPSSQHFLDLQSSAKVGIQLAFDETSYRTMFLALEETIAAKDNRLAQLRELFSGEAKPRFRNLSPMSLPWLNKTQEEAVNKTLAAKDVMIVHGPPGTGKTTTLVEAIYETLRRETQVMVCAQSNMAVDWISEKLMDRGINVLRIGNPSRVNDKMLSFTYERRFESHPDYAELWNVRQAIRQLQANRKKYDDTHQKIARLQDRVHELTMRINNDLFNETRVIACTLIGSASKILSRQNFSTLFIDEAAQALEPACWVAIRRCDRVVFAGDHQQLPPTIKCFEAMRQGLGKTLMERIVENLPEAVSLLKIQYRMNETIMRFSSDWFYHGAVESHPSVYNRSILDYDFPMMWIEGADEEGFKEELIDETGRINKDEADLVISTLINYINKIGKGHVMEERIDFGIISPYKAQTKYLRQRIRQTDELKPFRSLISVNTVDGFQGQERDVIVISLVRSNEEGNIGFLNDLRRMNVAMTRARKKLIIFGNKETLRHHKFYRKLIEYVEVQSKSLDLEKKRFSFRNRE